MPSPNPTNTSVVRSARRITSSQGSEATERNRKLDGQGSPCLPLRRNSSQYRQIELIDRFTGKVEPWMIEARWRGVLFDVGHGAGSFLWPVAMRAVAQGFVPDTISTDLHVESLRFQQSTMSNVMSKMMLLGMSFRDVLVRSTVNPAKEIGRYPESDRGFDMLLCNTEYDPNRVKAVIGKLITNQVRGVAVMTSTVDVEAAKELTSHGIAVVLHNQRVVRELIGEIRVDYSHGISQALECLINQGHRNFGIISGPLQIRSAVIVRDAFDRALEQRGLQAVRSVESNYRVDGGSTAVRSLLAHRPFPTALLCGNDLIAIGAMSVLEEEGVRVPEDVSVVGCDDIFFARLSRPPLTTVHVPREKLGRLSFEAIEKILAAKTRKGRQYTLATRLVVRGFTGLPKVSP
jgi:LacI family transcriptional regulator